LQAVLEVSRTRARLHIVVNERCIHLTWGGLSGKNKGFNCSQNRGKGPVTYFEKSIKIDEKYRYLGCKIFNRRKR
jgi:hypothetical protein